MRININEGGKLFVLYFSTKDKIFYFSLHWKLPAIIKRWDV